MFYLSRDLFGLSYNSFTGDSKMIKQESSTNSEQLNSKKPTTTGGQIEAVVIAQPKDCEGCAYNWGSFNTQPEDSYCYMFAEFMPGCKKHTKEFK